MKMFKKTLIASIATATLGLSFNPAMADLASDAEALFNWAETTYPQIFQTHQTTQQSGPWIYRHYAANGVYAGINKNDNKVYVMGAHWGSTPVVVGPLTTLMATVEGNNGNNTVTACDATALPTGMTMTQNGSTITISTGGNCIEPPTDQNLCDIPVPAQPTRTGISVLSTTNLIKSELKGFSSTIPGVADAFLQSGNFTSCVINAPSEEYTNYTVNMDVCYDMTNTFAKNGVVSQPPFLTITPPVQQLLTASTTSTKVTDCFATGATTVSDLFTGENWIKNQNGTYQKL
jgi:hypothetical protein